ncbi:MAG: YdcF family protein [Chitinispirillales bacterium]|nr:YdcF family protein [Chitinispirillales bacterium]
MIFFIISALAVLLIVFKKKTAGIIVLIFAFFSLCFFSSDYGQNVLAHPLESSIPVTNPQEHLSVKTVIVLGGGRYEDSDLPANAILSPTSICRLVEGIRVFNLINANNLVFTGNDFVTGNSIATLMKQCAVDLGVNETKIIAIEDAKNTREEAKRCAEYFMGDTVFLVSSAAHLKRAAINFENEGVFVIQTPTDYQIHKKNKKIFFDFFPNSQRLVNSGKCIHEYLGLFWEKFKELCLFWK